MAKFQIYIDGQRVIDNGTIWAKSMVDAEYRYSVKHKIDASRIQATELIGIQPEVN